MTTKKVLFAIESVILMVKSIPKMITLLLSIFVLGYLSFPVGASVSSKNVGVDISPNETDLNASDITVQWSYSAGDVLEKSVNGADWVAVSQSSNGLAVVEAVPNWSILYFRIKDNVNSIVAKFTAYPPNLNAHDTYASNTSLCAGCHVTHAAEGRKLLKAANQKELCRICHGYLNTGSRYNTDNGAVIIAGNKNPDTGMVTDIVWAKSLAGPLESNDLEVWGAGKTVTSRHDYGANRDPVAGTGSTVPSGSDCTRCHGGGFSCKSCHLVHGGQGTYRQLDPFCGTVTAYAYNPTGNQPETPIYVSGMAQFCGFCHNLLLKPEDSGHIKTGTIKRAHGFAGSSPESKYRHPVGVDLTYTLPGMDTVTVNPAVLPTEGNPRTVSCITCHFAHGTVSDAYFITNFPVCFGGAPMGTNGSMLVRDRTGRLCQDCHPKE